MRLLDYLPTQSISAPSLEVIVHSSSTGAPAPTAEGAAKPEVVLNTMSQTYGYKAGRSRRHLVRDVHGLRAAGRYLAVEVTIPDRPCGLSMLLGVVSESGASVLVVVHSRTAPKLALDEVEVLLTVETRGPAQRQEVLAAPDGAGFVISVAHN
jgi:hypothetical protein